MARINAVKDVLTTQKKLAELQQSIQQLQEQERQLQEEKAKHFHHLLSEMGALTIDPDILVGSLLHTIEACNNNAQEIGEWQKAGRQFLAANTPAKKVRTASKTSVAPASED